MGRRTTFLAGTMIFWLPVLFLTTYVGFYEAYKGAMENEFLGLDYPQEFATILIIPAMIPTIFTAHAILNREKMTLKLIDKLNIFHSRAEDGKTQNLEEAMLTSNEYESLNVLQKVEYCRDLKDVGKSSLSNRLLKEVYLDYRGSTDEYEKAIALYSRTLITDGSVDQKEMYESSEMAYELISKNKTSEYYPIIVTGHILELPYLGYEAGLLKLRGLENEVEDNYLSVLIEIRKLYFLYRMQKITKINFADIEGKINFNTLDKFQRDRLEIQLAKIKNELLLDFDKFEELEIFLHQRRYHYKWNAKETDSIENTLGRMYRKTGQYDKSLECFNANLTYGRKINSPHVEGVALVNLGKTNMAMDNHDHVKHFSKQALEVFSKIDFARGVIEALTLFVNASKAMGEDCSEEERRLEGLVKIHGIMAQDN